MSQQTLPLTIDRIAFGGKGVGRLPDGIVCFVPDVAPGERVFVEITKRTKRFAEGRVTGFSERSARRVDPPCPYFGTCGGCVYQHLAYPDQLEIKAMQVRETLQRLGGLTDPKVLPVVASPAQYGYRNRITVHGQRGKVGFYERGGRTLVDIKRCLIASEPVNVQLHLWRTKSHEEGVRTLREDNSRRGFHQTNDAVAALLLQAVEDTCAAGGELLVDAYCGSGFFAKRLATHFQRVIGIDWNPDAIDLARVSAGPKESYLSGDVALLLDESLKNDSASAVVILDPPAQGVDAAVVATLLHRQPEQILYISCDPATLARDLKLLAQSYDLSEARPFDMFPQTAEVEVLSVLRRRS